MRVKPQNIQTLFKRPGQLHKMQEQAHLQTRLLSDIRSLVPSQLGAHLTSTVQKRGTLVLYTDSPVWKNKLRFQAPTLLQSLRQKYPGIANIEVKTQLARRDISRAKRRPPPIRSAAGAQTIASSATNIDSPQLRAALERLAKTLQPK